MHWALSCTDVHCLYLRSCASTSGHTLSYLSNLMAKFIWTLCWHRFVSENKLKKRMGRVLSCQSILWLSVFLFRMLLNCLIFVAQSVFLYQLLVKYTSVIWVCTIISYWMNAEKKSAIKVYKSKIDRVVRYSGHPWCWLLAWLRGYVGKLGFPCSVGCGSPESQHLQLAFCGNGYPVNSTFL